ncbi:MAG: MurR/RpiR family transcriptional regulator [Caldibacillus debilis]|jgi:DNA-binding MurR/RpiR family transcriptional regulator|uniref:Transcriptional regulator, RpiR family n=3 Tax=Caldibacillus debilis TaxID=301148 RepID=A0A420VGU0_9BACI|nr:MurR/RpiR family transcriptional regulator [Caldibacillus debilis]MBY6272811.1 MurR/RpiR family transcriptional regulator [Bacillaceae bacterium]REJ13467.1 MAG: MurR/RpiR family transcriptional regulator [Caldibacillus debilis]REJ25899.1 MAG: MurR/RpiR family transcriptional regulator [Caldibacillus debilis]RKO62851.1 transcriptional regulator, RpiR family [Caldibacillus debilis GB1]
MNTVIKRINEKYKYLSPSHKAIANFLLNNHEKIPHLTARELAEQTLNVPSSIISFSKKLGFKGFNELKYSYMNDEKNNQTVDDEIVKALMKAEEVTKRKEFKEAVRLLLEAPRIFIMAFQMSQIPAKDFYFRMRKIEPSKMIFFETYADQFRMVSMMGDDDVVLIVSNSGEAEEILEIEKELSKKKCKQILVTNGINSSLSKYATIELSVGCLEDDPVMFKEVPTKARYALIYLLEKIFLEILHIDFEEKRQRIINTSKFFKG